MGTDPSADELAGALRTLAHPQRLRIIGLLDEKVLTVEELSRSLGFPSRAVSRHLAALERAHLVWREDGPARNGRYRLDHQRAVAINSLYFALLGRAASQALQQGSLQPSLEKESLPLAPSPPGACSRCQYSFYVFGLLDDLNRMLGESREYQSRLRHLSSQVLTAHEEERKRIARDLHDDTAQALTSLLVRLRLLERSSQERELQAGFQELRELTSSTLEGVRRLALDLRPSSLDDLGLTVALASYVNDFSQHWPIRAQFSTSGPSGRLPAPVELALYRVVQEALTNVAKHAQATRATVNLQRQGNVVQVTIEDDGRGFDAAEIMRSRERGLGLFGMQERLGLIGGRLDIESRPGGGTSVRAEVTLPRPRAPRRREQRP